MAFPPVQRTWTFMANNALGARASLNALMASYLLDVSQFLLANGLTCKGSCNGVAGAMDGVNRWASAADTLTRGASLTDPQSWMALVDGNGCNFLLAYTGGTDDICQISFSPTGIYVADGTPTFTPVADDELVLAAGVSVVNNTISSTGRVMFMWIDATASAYRLLLTLADGGGGNPCGVVWGIEPVDDSLQDRPFTPPVWGFAYLARFGEFAISSSVTVGFTGPFLQSNRGGRARINGVAVNLSAGFQLYQATGSFSAPWSDTQPNLQGGVGYPIWGPPRIGSVTIGMTGLTANLVDWWSCRFSATNASNTGDTYGPGASKDFMAVGTGGGILWPWDGVTTPVTGGAVASQQQPGQHTGFENGADPDYATLLSGASMYVPLPNSIVTPTGPEAVRSIDRRAGSDVIRILTRTDDPPVDPSATQLYSRLIGGVPALFARYPNGDVYEVGAGGVT
jgi:hypothetical protein